MTIAEALDVLNEAGFTIRAPKRPRRKLSVHTRVVHEVCREFGAAISEVMGPCRAERLVVPRRACYWALRQMGLSLPKIASQLGGRNHTSVLHGLRNVRLSEAKAALRAIRIVEARTGQRVV